MSRTISRSAAGDDGEQAQSGATSSTAGSPVTPYPPPRPRTRGDEGVAPLGEDLHEVVGEVTAGQVETHDGVGQSVALVDGHVVGDAIPGVEDDAWEEGRKVREGAGSQLGPFPITGGPRAVDATCPTHRLCGRRRRGRGRLGWRRTWRGR